MAIDISSLAIQIKSEGITKATGDLKDLAEAAKSVDKETKSFIATANTASNTKLINDADKQAIIQQKRDTELYNVAVKQYVQAHTEAISINKALIAEEDRRNLLQQKRDIDAYNASAKEYTKAHQEALAINKALIAEEARRNLLAEKQKQEAYNAAMKEYARVQAEAISMNKALIAEENRRNLNAQKQQMDSYNASAKDYARTQAEAIAMNKAMKAEEDKRNLIQQKRDYEQYTAKVKDANKAHQEATETIKNMNGHGSIWNNTLKSMAVAASAYIGVNMAKGIIEQGDAWQMMQSKLKIATGSSQEAIRTQSGLYDLAQKLRIPLEDASKLYIRMSVPLQQLGKSSQDTMGMVEGMGLALKLSGATAQEASSVMLQFSQSMNSGKLQGQEFNAVAEGAPMILRAIEDELRRTGKWGENTTKTLKKMGSEGKIGAQLLSDAMANALPKWRQDFESLPLTVDGAMQRLKNAWYKAIGEMSKSTGLNEKLAETVTSIEQSLPRIAEILIKTFIAIYDNLKPISILIGSMIAINLAEWLVKSAIAFDALAAAIAVAGTALTALSLAAVIPALLAIGGAIGYATAAWIDYKIAGGDAVKKTTEYAETEVGNIARVNRELTKQLETIYKVNQAKAVDSGEEKYAKEKTRIEELNKSIIAGEQELSKMREGLEKKGKTAIIESMELSISRNKTDKAFLEQQVAQANAVQGLIDLKNKENESIKYRAELNKKLKFDDAALMKDEIEGLDKAKLSATDYEKAVAKIKEKYTETNTFKKTSLDYDQKALAALKEIQQAYEQISKTGLDDKRTAGEKQLVKLEQELEVNISRRAESTKKGTLVQLKQEEAIIRSAIATTQETIAIEKLYNAKKDELKATQEDISSREKALDTATKEADVLEQAIKNHGKLAKSKEEVNLQYALEEQELLSVQANKEKELVLNAQLIEQLQRTVKFRQQLNEQAETDKAAKKYEADWQAANKKIGDGLYEALSSNGTSFVKKLIKDMKEWFARLVLSPIIQPIAAMGASLLNPLAASASGVNAASTGSSMVSGVGNLFSSFMNLGTNFAGQIGSSLGSIGTKIGSDFLASVGGGINGAGVGSGLGSTVGMQIGSALAPVLQAVPYIAAAYAVYSVLKSGFSMGEKQITGSNVSGTLGTENINRNVNWSQQGGMFRSDRSGTWSYNLANSVAMADGVGYTDTASLTSDKALLKALNDSYAALKTSTQDYAKILGINADDISKRNDEMSFAIGKTADETNTNISNMFKDIGNKMATSIIGSYAGLAKENESAAETLTRLAVEVTTVDAAVKNFGLTFSTGMMQVFQTADAAFSQFVNYTTEQLVQMKDALVQASGGLEAFISQSAYFAQNFLSEAEKIKPSQDQVAKIFDQYHITNINTIDDYKKLVQGIDLSTDSGRAMYAALMLLAPTFKQVADYSNSSANSATALAEALATTNKGIQDQIDALLKSDMTTEQIRAKELEGADASTQALLRRLYALQDEKSAMDASTARLKAAADERYGLETQLLQLQGKTDELRQRELDKLDPSNQELQKRIWALQDEQAAAAAKAQADQAAAQAAQQAADQAAQAAKAVKDAWQSITNTIMDEVKRIRGLVDEASGMGFAEAQSKFAIATAQARSGDQEAAKLLPSLSQALLTLAEKNARTAEELAYIRSMTANSLAQTATGYSTNYGVTLPSFDVGTDSVPKDMIAQIHAGEEIVPAAYTGKNNAELITEIKSLKEEVSKMRTESNAQQQAIATSTDKTAKVLTRNDFGAGIWVTTSLPTA